MHSAFFCDSLHLQHICYNLIFIGKLISTELVATPLTTVTIFHSHNIPMHVKYYAPMYKLNAIYNNTYIESHGCAENTCPQVTIM